MSYLLKREKWLLRYNMIGLYNFKKILFTIISINLYILGMLSVNENLTRLFEDGSIRNYYLFITGLIVNIIITVFGVCWLKNKYQPLLVSIPFSVYSLSYFMITNIENCTSYFLIVINVILLTISMSEKYSINIVFNACYIFLSCSIFLAKYFLHGMISWIELNNKTVQYNEIGFYLFSMFVSIIIISFFAISIYEHLLHKEVKNILRSIGLSSRETEFFMLHLEMESGDGIAKKMGINKVTYRRYKNKIREKKIYFGRYKKDDLWAFLNTHRN